MVSEHSILAVDLGKTSCRLGLWQAPAAVAGGPGEGYPAAKPGPAIASAQVHGAVGLAEAAGADRVADVLLRGLKELGVEPDDSAAITAVGMGLAGYHAAPQQAAALLETVARWWPGARVTLAGDVTTTHVGALRGSAGTVVAAGTGAVALAVADDAVVMRDGWGYLLGDDGSGFTIGRAGLRAALSQRSPVLSAAAQARFGELSEIPAVMHGADHPSRMIASFASDVASAAREGDEVARQIWQQAGAQLAASGVAAHHAAGSPGPVCVAGGVAAAHDLLADPFTRAVRELDPQVTVVEASGTSLDGARILAQQVPEAFAQQVLTREPHQAEPQIAVPALAGSAEGDLAQLQTEQVGAGLSDLDERPTESILQTMWEAEAGVPAALQSCAAPLAAAVDGIADRMRRGGRLFYFGAGTPGRLAMVDASEIPPTYGTDPDQVIAVMAGGDSAMSQAMEGAEDSAEAAEAAVSSWEISAADSVIGISASGRTPYVLGALRQARARGALTLGVSNNPDTDVSRAAEHAIEVLTGPEVVAGSTRLKAGTAQKLVLNAISTAVMIRLGKTYGPLMVDMRATNEKLRARATRMVMAVAGVDQDRAQAALQRCDWHTAVAIVAAGTGVEASRAQEMLAAAGGSVRQAMRTRKG